MSELEAWKKLADEVSRGNVMLEVSRENLDAAVKHLQDYIDSIDEMGQWVTDVANVAGFGGFKIGVQLAQKFTQKGSGDESIRQRLKELQTAAESLQDSIRKAATAYTEADHAHAQALNAVTPK
jgi:uncharacterized protein YukE